MRTLYVIGIGAGSPRHLTLEAVDALSRVDAVVAFDKGEDKEELLALRRQILAEHAPQVALIPIPDPPRDRTPSSYVPEVRRWLEQRRTILEHTITTHIPEDGSVAMLIWGDPALYDSTLRIVKGLSLEIQVIPGITAIQALTAAHGIPLNTIGSDIHITTGRRFPEAQDQSNCVVMLDGGSAWEACKNPQANIWWGAYVGMEMQVLRHGVVGEISDELRQLKQSLRQQHGWIMDIYLIRD